jgi:hypothetical protein
VLTLKMMTSFRLSRFMLSLGFGQNPAVRRLEF